MSTAASTIPGPTETADGSSAAQETAMATRVSQTGPAADRSNPASGGEPTIDEMRTEIDAIDAELVRLIQRRSEISHAIGATRAAEGGTRIVYSREMKVLDRFAALGPAGTELGMLLLSLGRGQLGRR